MTATSDFIPRHIGPSDDDIKQMLSSLGLNSLDELMNQTIPEAIRLRKPLDLPAPANESDALSELRDIASKNKVNRSFIGMGYYGTITPGVNTSSRKSSPRSSSTRYSTL